MDDHIMGRYQMDSIHSDGKNHIVELAAAFINYFDPLQKDTILFLDSSISEVGSGDVASNLRFKINKKINDSVVKNTVSLLSKYNELNDRPIVITSIHRDNRLYSFKMNEDSTINVIDNMVSSRDREKEELLEGFLDRVNLTSSRIYKMRDASKGAKFYTYLADVLCFINQMNYFNHPEMFQEEYFTPNVVNTLTRGGELRGIGQPVPGEFILKEITLPNGKTWKPQHGYNYLYFEKGGDQPHLFSIPKETTVGNTYNQMWELMEHGDNSMKKQVRAHFHGIKEYLRWSDYFVNDIDDAITMCIILHAYMVPSLSDSEKKVKNSVEEIIEQLYTTLDER